MATVSEITSKNIAETQANVRNWGRLVYNVREYGLVGDGVTDDTVNLQDLIDLAILDGRKTIAFNSGVYYVTALTNADKVFFVGDNASFTGGYAGYIEQLGEMGVTQTEFDKYVAPVINVKGYGAVGDGVTDDTAAIQDAFNDVTEHGIVYFPTGDYLITSSITVSKDNIKVNFGTSNIIANLSSGGQVFSFGTSGDGSIVSGLQIFGGIFELSNPSSTANTVYLAIKGTKNFKIKDCILKNVSNGGIYVEAGCEDGLIDGITIDGKSGYSTIRGIWLNGGTASDYASQLVDISSITRNAIPVPIYAVKNVTISNCNITLSAYGVYLINTRDCKVENCYIDISGIGAQRCIALNNYSPRAKVSGNTLKSDRSSTGILCTQYSHDVSINDNTFQGYFGGNRDIYVQYLADALISDNRFFTETTQQILIDMGANAVIQGNTFNSETHVNGKSAVKITTIDLAVAGTSTYGDTATILNGSVFKGNVVKNRTNLVIISAPASTSGNIPGLDTIVVMDNVSYNWNLATSGGEYGLNISSNGTTYKVKYSFFNNVAFPEANANRGNGIVKVGTGMTEIRSDVQFATFTIDNLASGGAITGSKVFGGNFALVSLVRNGDAISVSPRTIGGASGADIARVVGITPISTNVYTFDIVPSSANYIIRLFDSVGTQILLSTTAASIYVHIVSTKS